MWRRNGCRIFSFPQRPSWPVRKRVPDPDLRDNYAIGPVADLHGATIRYNSPFATEDSMSSLTETDLRPALESFVEPLSGVSLGAAG